MRAAGRQLRRAASDSDEDDQPQIRVGGGLRGPAAKKSQGVAVPSAARAPRAVLGLRDDGDDAVDSVNAGSLSTHVTAAKSAGVSTQRASMAHPDAVPLSRKLARSDLTSTGTAAAAPPQATLGGSGGGGGGGSGGGEYSAERMRLLKAQQFYRVPVASAEHSSGASAGAPRRAAAAVDWDGTTTATAAAAAAGDHQPVTEPSLLATTVVSGGDGVGGLASDADAEAEIARRAAIAKAHRERMRNGGKLGLSSSSAGTTTPMPVVLGAVVEGGLDDGSKGDDASYLEGGGGGGGGMRGSGQLGDSSWVRALRSGGASVDNAAAASNDGSFIPLSSAGGGAARAGGLPSASHSGHRDTPDGVHSALRALVSSDPTVRLTADAPPVPSAATATAVGSGGRAGSAVSSRITNTSGRVPFGGSHSLAPPNARAAPASEWEREQARRAVATAQGTGAGGFGSIPLSTLSGSLAGARSSATSSPVPATHTAAALSAAAFSVSAEAASGATLSSLTASLAAAAHAAREKAGSLSREALRVSTDGADATSTLAVLRPRLAAASAAFDHNVALRQFVTQLVGCVREKAAQAEDWALAATAHVAACTAATTARRRQDLLDELATAVGDGSGSVGRGSAGKATVEAGAAGAAWRLHAVGGQLPPDAPPPDAPPPDAPLVRGDDELPSTPTGTGTASSGDAAEAAAATAAVTAARRGAPPSAARTLAQRSAARDARRCKPAAAAASAHAVSLLVSGQGMTWADGDTCVGGSGGSGSGGGGGGAAPQASRSTLCWPEATADDSDTEVEALHTGHRALRQAAGLLFADTRAEFASARSVATRFAAWRTHPVPALARSYVDSFAFLSLPSLLSPYVTAECGAAGWPDVSGDGGSGAQQGDGEGGFVSVGGVIVTATNESDASTRTAASAAAPNPLALVEFDWFGALWSYVDALAPALAGAGSDAAAAATGTGTSTTTTTTTPAAAATDAAALEAADADEHLLPRVVQGTVLPLLQARITSGAFDPFSSGSNVRTLGAVREVLLFEPEPQATAALVSAVASALQQGVDGACVPVIERVRGSEDSLRQQSPLPQVLHPLTLRCTLRTLSLLHTISSWEWALAPTVLRRLAAEQVVDGVLLPLLTWCADSATASAAAAPSSTPHVLTFFAGLLLSIANTLPPSWLPGPTQPPATHATWAALTGSSNSDSLSVAQTDAPPLRRFAQFCGRACQCASALGAAPQVGPLAAAWGASAGSELAPRGGPGVVVPLPPWYARLQQLGLP